jgi:hypothetical protein
MTLVKCATNYPSHFIKTSLLCCLLLLQSAAWAANPTKIAFLSKESTFFGETYYVYRVSCSDRREAKISGWDKKRTWCPGINKKSCQNSRLKAASSVCR